VLGIYVRLALFTGLNFSTISGRMVKVGMKNSGTNDRKKVQKITVFYGTN